MYSLHSLYLDAEGSYRNWFCRWTIQGWLLQTAHCFAKNALLDPCGSSFAIAICHLSKSPTNRASCNGPCHLETSNAAGHQTDLRTLGALLVEGTRTSCSWPGGALEQIR